MNPYCRRAVAEGVTLARETGGSCTVVTLGPPAPKTSCARALPGARDDGLHVCDPAFAGSDTLATARTLAAVLGAAGPFDLVLLGRNSIDGETGQVGPELAELLGLPFASGVRQRRGPRSHRLRLELEHDDGTQDVEVALPAVLTVAERLCDPLQGGPRRAGRRRPARLRRADRRGPRPRPVGRGREPDGGRCDTTDGARTRPHRPRRTGRRAGSARGRRGLVPARRAPIRPDPEGRGAVGVVSPLEQETGRVVTVLAEPGRPQIAAELLGAAVGLAREVGARVHAFGAGGDRRTRTRGRRRRPRHHARWVRRRRGRQRHGGGLCRRRVAMGLPRTQHGVRPRGGRAGGCGHGSGLVGDAVALSVREDVLIAAEPAFAGALVADITCRGAMQMVTVRPGALPPGSSARA